MKFKNVKLEFKNETSVFFSIDIKPLTLQEYAGMYYGREN